MLAVIMAGGHGTRLWPLSTKSKPKQFQKILGNKTLLQAAFERLNFLKPEDIYVSTNKKFVEIVHQQLPELPKENIIIEPLRRDTGPAMAFVTHFLAQKGLGEKALSIIYSDQFIKDTYSLQEKLQTAQKMAKNEHKIVMIPVKAKEPNTNLGYIKLGDPQNIPYAKDKVYSLAAYIEKPNLEKAKEYTHSVDYLWNTGLWTWQINDFLKKLKKHAPEISKVLDTIKDHNNCSEEFSQFPKISIDYALMEKLSSKEVLILPADFEWSDVGNWQTVHEQLQDDSGNAVSGEVHTVDTENSIIYTNGRQKIVTIGVKDLAIISTEDTILICPKSESKRLKEMVEKLENQ